MTSVASLPGLDPALRRAAFIALAAAGGAVVVTWHLRRTGLGDWIPNGGRFWVIGLAVDLVSLGLLWFTTRRRGGPWVAIPGVGWMLYAVACITSPVAILLRDIAPASIGCLVARLAEFAALSLLHVTLQFLLPRLFLPKPTDT